jgi:hypothetical protein
MEDTQAQEASKFAVPVLTKEDLDRINCCDFYSKAKEVIQSTIDYKEYEVGAAIFIKRKYDNKVISSDYEGKMPEKYIIVQNDNGFVFAKRINANGKPGVAITCLTIDYGSNSYELLIDDSYIESMLLDTQDSYDPLADAKGLMKKKNKAARDNTKKRLIFDTSAEAYAFLKTVQVGDVFYTSDYLYGTGVTEYKVSDIEKRPANAGSGSGWSRNYGDQEYIKNGFKEVINVNLKVVSSTRRYSYDEKIEFRKIAKDCSPYTFFFQTRPVSPDDIVT